MNSLEELLCTQVKISEKVANSTATLIICLSDICQSAFPHVPPNQELMFAILVEILSALQNIVALQKSQKYSPAEALCELAKSCKIISEKIHAAFPVVDAAIALATETATEAKTAQAEEKNQEKDQERNQEKEQEKGQEKDNNLQDEIQDNAELDKHGIEEERVEEIRKEIREKSES